MLRLFPLIGNQTVNAIDIVDIAKLRNIFNCHPIPCTPSAISGPQWLWLRKK